MRGFHIISYCSLLPLLLKARIPEEHRYQVFKNFAKINRLVLTVMLADSQKNVWDDLQQGVNKEINLEFKKNFKIHFQFWMDEVQAWVVAPDKSLSSR